MFRLRPAAWWRAHQHAWWVDVFLIAALTAAAVWLTAKTGDQQAPPAPPDGRPLPPGATPSLLPVFWANLLVIVPLAGRRRWPLGCFVAQFAFMTTIEIEGNAGNLAAVLVGAYALALYGRSVLLSMGVLLAACAVTVAGQENTWPRLPGWTGVFVILMPIGLLGAAVRAARSQAHASEQRAEALTTAQQAATRLAVAEEQARIARELHDVVSHHVSVMTIQASAAGKVLENAPELAREALAAVEASGRETMTELRHLLGVLAPGPDDDLLHPQPGLDQLAALVDSVRHAGQPVTLRQVPVTLHRGADLTSYRVVQEALTNALRYAPGARTEVGITVEPPELVIEVLNDAPPGAGGPAPTGGTGTGTGLVGLAERLRHYGGTLESGRRVGGGFRLEARLPL